MEKELKCKKCGSKNISIKSGMFVDLIICKDCGWEDHTSVA